MSVQQVRADILGKTVTGNVVERIPHADAGDGIRDLLILDVDGSTFRVDESDATPR